MKHYHAGIFWSADASTIPPFNDGLHPWHTAGDERKSQAGPKNANGVTKVICFSQTILNLRHTDGYVSSVHRFEFRGL